MADSKLAGPFPVEVMMELLQLLEKSVYDLLNKCKTSGAKARKEVVGLLKTYMDLLAECRRQCMHFRDSNETLQWELEGVKEVLEVVLNGTVSDILTELGLEEYEHCFEAEGLTRAYQLMTDSSCVENLKRLNDGQRKKLRDKIEGLRRDLNDIKKHIETAKEEGEGCYKSSKEITTKFGEFLNDINRSRDKISTLLAGQPDKKKKMEFSYTSIAVIGIACLFGFMYYGWAWYTAAGVTTKMITATVGAGAGAVGCGVLTWHKSTEEPNLELEKIGKALTELQTKQLDAMNVEATKQMTAWKQLQDKAESVVCSINRLDKKTKDELQPSHHRDMKDALWCIQVVLRKEAELHTDVVEFEKEIKKAHENVRDMSLMKDHEIVLAEPDTAEPVHFIGQLADLLKKTTKGLNMYCGSAEQKSPSQKDE